MGAAYREAPALQSPWEHGAEQEAEPSPRGGREEVGGEDDPLPGRDDPEEFYKKPPRKLKRLDRLPA
jgi:hypothetical protein